MEHNEEMQPEQSMLEYTEQVRKRIDNLPDNDKDALLDLYGSAELVIISRVLGPEVTKAVAGKLNNLAKQRAQNPEGVNPKEYERTSETQRAIPTDMLRQSKKMEQDIPMPRAMEEPRELATR